MVKALKCNKNIISTKQRGEKESSYARYLAWLNFYSKTAFGIGIQCTQCGQWRVALEYSDSHEVPEHWECSMTKINGKKANCAMPSEFSEDDFGKEKYAPGSVVWAKMQGFPWWPGMVEDSPDDQQYYKEVPEKEDLYHVTFFVEKKAQRGWIPDSKITHFVEPPSSAMIKCSKIMENHLKKAEEIAKKAIRMTQAERLKKFSFGKRFKGPWGTAKCSDDIPIPPVSTKRKRTVVKSVKQSLKKVTEVAKEVSPDSSMPPKRKRGRRSKIDLEKEKNCDTTSSVEKEKPTCATSVEKEKPTCDATSVEKEKPTCDATSVEREKPTCDAIDSGVKEDSVCDAMIDEKSNPAIADDSFKTPSPIRSPGEASAKEADLKETDDESDVESLEEYTEIELALIKEAEEINRINMYNRIKKKLLEAIKNGATSDDEVSESEDMDILSTENEEEDDMDTLESDIKEGSICREIKHSAESTENVLEKRNPTLIESESEEIASETKEGDDSKLNGGEAIPVGEDGNLQAEEKDSAANRSEISFNSTNSAAKNGPNHGNTFLPPSEISVSKERLESFLNQSCNLLCEPIGYETVPVSEKA